MGKTRSLVYISFRETPASVRLQKLRCTHVAQLRLQSLGARGSNTKKKAPVDLTCRELYEGLQKDYRCY